jgi:hypothetical protein
MDGETIMKVGEKLYCHKTGYFNGDQTIGNEFAIKGKSYPILESYDGLVEIIDEEGKRGWTVDTDKFREHFMKPLIPRKIKKHKL